MNKTLFKIILLFILYISGCTESKSQSLNLTKYKENISLYTDRTLYIIDENIQFAAFIIIDANADISKILNVELITPDGLKISEGKYSIENSFCSGSLKIPNDIETGPYYLRAYTKFMRNHGPSSYTYISLKILNPFKEAILKYNPVKSTYHISTTKKDSLNNQTLISISLDKKEYSFREVVNININNNFHKENPLRGATITIIPEYACDEKDNINPLIESNSVKQFYYPELSGLSLTGEIKDSRSEKKIANAIVNLSILGDCKDFMAVNTDSTGRFYFKLPDLKGERTIFLNTETSVDLKSIILIDNDFCQNQFKIPTDAFQLNDKEKKAAYNFAINNQIASHFSKENISDSIKHKDIAFYGEPQIKIDLTYYIQLPTIEDYINELIPILKIKRIQGKTYFKIISEQEEMDLFKPLVLVDMVAIDNPEKVLALSTEKISRFEIVKVPYIKGDMIYGGIISIFSKKGDFADIDLPSSGVLLDYNFIYDYSEPINNEPPPVTKPDTRNTLFWLPNISLTSKSNDFSFTTSDTPGKYIVLLRGITDKGEKLICKSSFEVK